MGLALLKSSSQGHPQILDSLSDNHTYIVCVNHYVAVEWVKGQFLPRVRVINFGRPEMRMR